ncbi:hypothetical protein OPQ81_006499 [Rhizoctonia solani]|nr:hypothetical protein OPQ81_006499 [Rhizoctonia solani]
MVFDATAKAFNFSESTNNHSSNASTSATVLPTLPATTTRPTKRRRITQPGTTSSTPTPSPAPTPIVDLDALDAARRRAAGRVMSLWESLAEKYARAIEEDDEIDILTGKICRDRGVLRSVSERGWKIGSFGEALEVEPLVLVSEGETETGASEADDEGDAEDDTEGEGAEDREEGEEDPLGSWSYDWQYQDLKEFLAAENAIQENRRKNGKQPEPEDDDIVYLGDSLHNTDGTLRTDETSDDEFASMVMTDNSTIRYVKHEDDDEVDDVEPMASILGALALGRTPKKQPLHHPSSPRPRDEEMDHPNIQLLDSSQNNVTGQDNPTVPQTGAIRPSTGTSSAGISGLDVDDDLIVIDSDSDDELEPIDNSGIKPGTVFSSPSKPILPPASASTSSAQTQHASSTAFVSSIRPRSPVAQSARIPKLLVTGETTPLKVSGVHQPPSNVKRVPSLVTGSPVLAPAAAAARKSVSKRGPVEPTLGLQTPSSRAATTNSHLQGGVLESFSAIRIASTPTKKGSSEIPAADSRVKSPNETEAQVKAGKRKATMSGTRVKEKPSLSQSMTACLGPPPKVDTPSPDVPISAPTASPILLTQPKSPVRRRKKATVVEVVLPASRKAHKIKPVTASNQRSQLQLDGSASSSESLESIPETTHHAPSTSLVIKSGMEPGLKRKRSLGGLELTETAANALESRTSTGSVGPRPDPLHAFCPPAQLGLNQHVACCPAHPQHHSGSHSHAPVSHSAHTSCSAHHHLGIPVYQHQHQHQHLHTHLPYPFPQLPYTANELTEAAFKLIHGLSTFHQASGVSGSPGTGFWVPGAQLPFGIAIPSQAGPSSQTLAPKLEEPSSQETTSNERIPSSQEHERKAEAMNNPPDEKPNQTFPILPRLEDGAAIAPDPLFETHTKATIPVVTPPSSSSSKLPSSEREMSVIDIESDSDDELAVCDAGAGSMRWEPPVKKEVDTGAREDSRRQLSPRKSPVNGRVSSRTSPIKLKRMP